MPDAVDRKWLPVKEIGSRVRAIRTALGLSQAEFAARLGRAGSQSEVSKLETGGSEPDPGFLLDVALLGDTTLDYFREGGTAPRPVNEVVADWLEKRARELRTTRSAAGAVGKAKRAKGVKGKSIEADG